MALIINKAPCKLSDSNAFYEITAHNVSTYSYQSSDGKIIPDTTDGLLQSLLFSTGGDFKGVVLGVTKQASQNDYGITVHLQEDIAGTWTTVSSCTKTISQLFPSEFTTVNSYIINFDDFDNVVTVDTSADKWRLSIVMETSTTSRHYIRDGRDGTTLFHLAYIDNSLSYTDGDFVCYAHEINHDIDCSFDALLGTGDTQIGTCAIMCSDLDMEPYFIVKDNTSEITITLNGVIPCGAYSGVRVGESDTPISLSNRVNIRRGTNTVGTNNYTFANLQNAKSYGYERCYGHVWEIYGEMTDGLKQFTKLTTDQNIGDTVLNVEDDVSTLGWNPGDTLIIGGMDTQSYGSINQLTIDSIGTDTITLTSGVSSYKKLEGGHVMKYDESDYSITLGFGDDDMSNDFMALNSYKINGVYMNCRTAGPATRTELPGSDEFYMKNCLALNTNPEYQFYGYIHSDTFTLQNFMCARTHALQEIKVPPNFNTEVIMTDYIVIGKWRYADTLPGCKTTITNVVYENSYLDYNIVLNLGGGSVVNGLKVHGVSGNYCIYTAGKIVNSTIKNVTLSRANTGFSFAATAVVVNSTFSNVYVDDDTQPVTTPIYVAAGAYLDCEFKGINTGLLSDTADLADGGLLRFTNYETVDNVDIVQTKQGNIVRCGDGLTDTTVRTTGDDKFCIRFDSNGSLLTLDQRIPIGNTLGKISNVGVWCKTASDDYWAGTYQMPRLTVEYDGGDSTAYAEASKTSGAWQYLIVPINPTTTIGEIKITLSSKNNQDIGVYFDDFSTFLVPGTSLELGGFDLFSRGLPIGPYISTGVSAADVINYPMSSATTPGSMGEGLRTVNEGVKKSSILVPHSEDI